MILFTGFTPSNLPWREVADIGTKELVITNEGLKRAKRRPSFEVTVEHRFGDYAGADNPVSGYALRRRIYPCRVVVVNEIPAGHSTVMITRNRGCAWAGELDSYSERAVDQYGSCTQVDRVQCKVICRQRQ
jgi:hypothetical protein